MKARLRALLGAATLSVLSAITLAGFLAILPVPATAHEVKVGDLVIEHPWARATPPGAEIGGGFVTIENHGKTADRLTGGSLDGAKEFQIHEMAMDNGVMKMRQLPGLDIPAGGTVTLAPGGYHVMFVGLAKPLKQGTLVPGTLVFEHAGTVKVEFKVEAVGAKGPEHGGAKADGHSGHSDSMPGMNMN